jgi:uncharacterized protein DUF3592
MDSVLEWARLQQSFVPPAGLGRSRPRDVRLTGGGRAVMAVVIALLAAAVTVGIAMYREAIKQSDSGRALVETGVVTSGEVTRLWRSGENKRPRVAYRFVLDGRPYEGDARIPLARYQQLSIGAPLPIRYVPASPEVNDLAGTPASPLPSWLPFVVSGGLAALGFFCFAMVNAQKRLLAEGRAAPAVVTKHIKHHTSHGTHRSLTYEFPLPSGTIVKGKSSTSSKPPAVGSVICVLYDPDRPTRSATYPLSLVRP